MRSITLTLSGASVPGSTINWLPDYSWLQPGEVKTVRGYWYPVRDIGGVKNATRDAAVNLEVSSGVARFGFQVTSGQKGTKALLRSGGSVIWEKTADLAPGNPLSAEVRLPSGIREDALEAVLTSSFGTELVSYRVEPKRGTPRPEPYRPPAEPKYIKTNEELYLAGLRLEQFYNADREPYPYYEEALRRDPGDYRVNTALGLLYLKRGMYKEAETRRHAAFLRATQNHTRPKDGEALYYLGIALRLFRTNHRWHNALLKSITKASRINAVTQVILYMNSGMKVVDACREGGMPCGSFTSTWKFVTK